MNNYLVLGTWNAICDRCGFKYKADQLKSEWTGLKVCPTCWEPRHPADLMKVKSHDHSPPWTRPEQPDLFLSFEDYWTDEYGMTITTDLDLTIY